MFRFLFLLIDLRSRAIIWSPFRSCLRWNLRCCNGLTLNWSLRLHETFFRTINLSVPQGESFSLSTTSFWSTLLLYLLCSEYTSTQFFPQTFLSFFLPWEKKKSFIIWLQCLVKAFIGHLLPIPHLFSEWSTLSRLFRRLNHLQTQQRAASQVRYLIYGFLSTCRQKICWSDKDNSPVVENFWFSRSLVSIYDLSSHAFF